MFFSFVFCSSFVFLLFLSFLSKNRQKLDTAKKQKKTKLQKKKTDISSVSAVVFTNRVPNFWGGGLKNADFCGKHYKMVSAYFEKGQETSRG